MNDVEEFDEVFERNDTEGFDEVLEMNDDIFFECDDGLNVSDSETETPIHLSQKLLLFFQIFNISHRAMEYLLTILKDEGIDVPTSVYNLNKLKKKESVQIMKSSVNEHSYGYISIVDTIKFALSKSLFGITSLYNNLNVIVNVDGLPIFRSSPITLWPILISFKNMNTHFH